MQLTQVAKVILASRQPPAALFPSLLPFRLRMCAFGAVGFCDNRGEQKVMTTNYELEDVTADSSAAAGGGDETNGKCKARKQQ